MTDTTHSLEDFTLAAQRMADAAREAIRPYFRAQPDIEHKDDDSPVTIADKNAEKAIRAIIEESFPEHGIIGEEFGSKNEDADYVWVIDPIDGTQSFVTGVPLYCTLIALLHKGTPILGLIDQPNLKERWMGRKDRKTTLNGTPVSCRSCASLPDATLMATALDMFNAKERVGFDRLQEATARARFSADAYGYALLATGCVDIVCESSMKFHDFAALIPIIDGAGGKITDWAGNTLTQSSAGRILACGDKELHTEVIKLLALS